MDNELQIMWNATHTSGYHGKWSRNQATFKLLSTHIFWSKSGSSADAKGPLSAPSTQALGVPMGQLNGLINCYKTEAYDGMLGSFLTDLQGLIKPN